MKHFVLALRVLILMTVLTGIVYPLTVTGVAQLLFKSKANGSLIEKNGQIIGSELVAQKFEGPRYFWPRPSAGDYNPLPSGGSNQGQSSSALKKQVDERIQKLNAAHENQKNIPQDLLFASGSGLDPHISPESAIYQVIRVAKTRNISVDQLRNLVKENTEVRQLGVLGEPRVNVLKLNLALDQMSLAGGG